MSHPHLFCSIAAPLRISPEPFDDQRQSRYSAMAFFSSLAAFVIRKSVRAFSYLDHRSKHRYQVNFVNYVFSMMSEEKQKSSLRRQVNSTDVYRRMSPELVHDARLAGAR